MELKRVSPEEARRRAVDRYSDPLWLARQSDGARLQDDHVRAWRAAEAPLAAGLQALGYAIDSAWELYLYEDYDDAIPLLVEHLAAEYPDRVRDRCPEEGSQALLAGPDRPLSRRRRT